MYENHFSVQLSNASSNTVPAVSSSACNHGPPRQPVLLHLQDVTIRGQRTTLFLDDGSNVSLITPEFAKKLGLEGKPIEVWMTLASKQPELVDSTMYVMKLTNNDGITKKVKFLEVPTISSVPEPVDVSVAYDMFKFVDKGDLERPTEPIGLLLGQDCSEFLPTGGGTFETRVGGLRCMRSCWGTGWVLGGRHPQIVSGGVQYSQAAAMYRSAATLAHPEMEVNAVKVSLPDCYTTDDIGVKTAPKCKKCSSCLMDCNIHQLDITREQAEAVKIIRAGVTLDTETKTITCKYPVNEKVQLLRDNRWQAIRRAIGVENGLRRRGDMDTYNSNFLDAIQRGAVIEVSQEALDQWQKQGGITHYINHFPVYKDSSPTTPQRIVSDAAMKNNVTGPSLNDCMPQNLPNSLNNLLIVFLRWRLYEVAMVYDLKKAYNSLRTTDFEAYLRCMVWRWGDDSQPWSTFQYRSVAFGDQISATALEVGKQLVANRGEELGYPGYVMEKLTNDTYVDDSC